MTAPNFGGQDAPLVHVPLNQHWLPYLNDLIAEKFLSPWYWEGTEAEKQQAVERAEELLWGMGNAYSRVGIIELHVLENLPPNLHPCDGTELARADYPILYDEILPRYRISATHLALPDMTDRFIKCPLPNQEIGDKAGQNTRIIGVNHLPSHAHGAGMTQEGTHYFIGQAVGGNQDPQTALVTQASGSETRIAPFSETDAIGDGEAFPIEPSYILIGHCINLW